LGVVIEEGSEGVLVVFIPDAPSPLSGSVAIVDKQRVTKADISPQDLLASVRRLGSGLVDSAQR